MMTESIPAKLAGDRSKQVLEELKTMKSDLDKHEKILRFFFGLDGQEELWAMAHILKGDGPMADSEELRVHHISDVAAAYSSKA